jgi:thioesterase domain-containing protein
VAVISKEISDKRKIIAYVVNKENHPVQSEELRSFIAEYLPAYMVPTMFVILPSLPLTPGGKIDRMVLPVPSERHLDQGGQFEASGTATEVALANIWCKLLGVDKIGIHENFFAAGGHSLLAVRMINEIRRRLAPDMPVRMPFQYPTIQELAKALLTEKFTKQNPELIQLQAGNSGPEIFLIVDGDSVGLFKLSHFMDKELRLYASVVPLPEPALRASAQKQFSAMPRMEDMAAAHVALIKSCQKTGPIVLVGYCIAGMIAFEVAQQLQTAGIRVEAVLMLNTWMKWPTVWWRKKARLRDFFGKLLQRGPRYLWQKSQQRISKKKADMAAQLELDNHGDFKMFIPQSIVNRINRHAVIGYRPMTLASHGILFVFEDDWMSKAYLSSDNSLGASKLFTGGLEVINVPADNVTVMEEKHLVTVAGYFNKCLRQFR